MTTPTIEQRARNAADDLQRQARTVSRATRPQVPDLERKVTLRRFAAGGATLVVALVAAVAWMQATQPAPPPLVSEGAEPTPDATSEAASPEPTPIDYPGGQVLAMPNPGDAAGPVSAEPDADTCGGWGPDATDMVTLIVGPGAEVVGPHSMIDCIVVWQDQRLRIAAQDGDYAAFTAELAGWRFRLAPGQAVVLDMPVGQYLNRGAHLVESDYEPARAIVFWPPPTDSSENHP